ncbi:MAG: glycoside hydrolase family 5 protein [Fibrobacter sp.]|nr:glycoside hydrolase family 5 protein [Fibrobacter sp.]
MKKRKLWLATAAASILVTSPLCGKELPTANEIFNKMGFGINIGNTMEVPGNPTGWGNKFPSEAYIDSVKAAGFSTIRIPCAWDSHAQNSVINQSWMDSVQVVVDRAMRAGLITILNIHWDGGWLEENLKDEKKDEVNAKQKAYWTQIATHFKNYNERLLFASANEPATTDDNYRHESEILEVYHQTFVDAVRATGGNNASRTLIIQGPSTSIDRSVEVYGVDKLPKDVIENRLMFEVHYYDPYTYTLMNEPADWGAIVQPQYYWGTGDNLATGDDVVHNCGYNAWANAMGDPCTQSQMDASLAKMKANYVDKGVPVIIGEFGANDRIGVLSGENYAKHRRGRLAYYEAFMNSSKTNQVVPIAWDTGHEGENNMTIIRRQSGTDGSVFDLDVLNIMRKAYGLGDYVNLGLTHDDNFVDNGDTDAIQNRHVQNSTGLANSMNLRREGFKLLANGNIKLFDINGNMIRKAQGNLNLNELKPGFYIAKSGMDLLKVHIR